MNLHKTNLGVIEPGLKIDDEIFLVTNMEERKSSKGTSYYDLELRNSLGKGYVKVWTITEPVKKNDYIRVNAEGVDHYRYGQQWKLNYYTVDKTFQGDDGFKKHVKVIDVDSLFSEMINYDYQNFTVKLLRDAFLSQPDLIANFKKVPASVGNHHSYIGGLVKHTHEVWSLTKLVLPMSRMKNPDIALFGALIHDISKVAEYRIEDNGEFTSLPFNGLVNNTVGGVLYLDGLKRLVPHDRVDPKVYQLLQHIVVSHQMRREWASPVAPACPEAIVVAHMDLLSANLEHYFDALEKDKEPLNEFFTSPYFFYSPNGHSSRVYKVPEIDNDFGNPFPANNQLSEVGQKC